MVSFITSVLHIGVTKIGMLFLGLHMFGGNVFWALLQSDELSNFSFLDFPFFFPGNKDPSKKSCWEKDQAPIRVIPRVPKLGLLGWDSEGQNQNSQSPFLALENSFLQDVWWKPLDTRPWGNWSVQKWTMDQGCHYALPFQQSPNRSLLKTVELLILWFGILHLGCKHFKL